MRKRQGLSLPDYIILNFRKNSINRRNKGKKWRCSSRWLRKSRGCLSRRSLRRRLGLSLPDYIILNFRRNSINRRRNKKNKMRLLRKLSNSLMRILSILMNIC